VVEGTRLESEQTLTGLGSSNLPLSDLMALRSKLRAPKAMIIRRPRNNAVANAKIVNFQKRTARTNERLLGDHRTSYELVMTGF
jgi:hypothetical protein